MNWVDEQTRNLGQVVVEVDGTILHPLGLATGNDPALPPNVAYPESHDTAVSKRERRGEPPAGRSAPCAPLEGRGDRASAEPGCSGDSLRLGVAARNFPHQAEEGPLALRVEPPVHRRTLVAVAIGIEVAPGAVLAQRGEEVVVRLAEVEVVVLVEQDRFGAISLDRKSVV